MLYTSNLKGKVTIMTAVGSEVSILPGAGTLDDSQWDQISDYPTITDMIENRLVEVVEPPKSEPAKTTSKTKAVE